MMIFVQEFNEHLAKHPLIATAFEEFKVEIAKYSDYKHFVSNFMHGAFRYTESQKMITTHGNLRLRTANIDDYDFINAAERDKDCTPWVNNWQMFWRVEKCGDNNFFQTIIETLESRRVGFIDFRDMLDETQVELKRIVIAERGKGLGKEAMYLSQKFAFEVLERNRLYLGTKPENLRAQHLYHATGFSLINPENIASFHMLKEDYIKRGN
jgi:RimJ/RimL family protein N-acetyltransferase